MTTPIEMMMTSTPVVAIGMTIAAGAIETVAGLVTKMMIGGDAAPAEPRSPGPIETLTAGPPAARLIRIGSG
jgi:hypothetical protein